MKFVRSYEVFRLLRDFAFRRGRLQFGRNRRVHDVRERARDFLAAALGGEPRDDVADERLGHADVHVIHGHVVAVEGAPAQSLFRKVSRSYHQAAAAVRHVHQNLRAFPRLRVFVGGVEAVRRVPDVAQVLLDGGNDGDFLRLDAETRHQVERVAARALGRSRPRQRETVNPRGIEPEPRERFLHESRASNPARRKRRSRRFSRACAQGGASAPRPECRTPRGSGVPARPRRRARTACRRLCRRLPPEAPCARRAAGNARGGTRGVFPPCPTREIPRSCAADARADRRPPARRRAFPQRETFPTPRAFRRSAR